MFSQILSGSHSADFLENPVEMVHIFKPQQMRRLADVVALQQKE